MSLLLATQPQRRNVALAEGVAGLLGELAARYTARPLPSETVAWLEALASFRHAYPRVDEDVELSESVAQQWRLPIDVAETVSYAEALGVFGNLRAAVADPLTLVSDALATEGTLAVGLPVLVALLEAVQAYRSAPAVDHAEDVDLAEAVGALRTSLIAVSEDAGLLEAITTYGVFVQAGPETVGLGEAVTGERRVPVDVADAVALAEALVAQFALGVNHLVSVDWDEAIAAAKRTDVDLVEPLIALRELLGTLGKITLVTGPGNSMAATGRPRRDGDGDP